ncbi:MAG: hypothetical protein H0X45_13980 [Planctomycetes bacterium]|nr:hypothetical protein [Planctomycetota bacterium]
MFDRFLWAERYALQLGRQRSAERVEQRFLLPASGDVVSYVQDLRGRVLSSSVERHGVGPYRRVYLTAFVTGPGQLYRPGDGNLALEPVLALEPGEMVDSVNQFAQPFVVQRSHAPGPEAIATDRRRLVIHPDGSTRPLPMLDRERFAGATLYAVGDGMVELLWHHLEGGTIRPTALRRVDRDGRVTEERELADIAPPPLAAEDFSVGTIAALVFVAIGCAIAAWRVATRDGWRIGWRISIALAALATGPVALVSQLILRTPSARERCDSCRAWRAVSCERCPGCGTAAQPPPRDGSEIFAPVPA